MTDEQFSQIMAILVRIEGGMKTLPAPDALLAALAGVFGRNEFTSSEAWTVAVELERTAETLGQRLPDLPHELQLAGITTTHGLGRYLGVREGRGVSRVGDVREGVLWKIAPAVSRGDETARTILRAG
ncbi:hypothetical protein JQX09_15630 [Sulfitobacter pseudonitzschiae]|uniref:Uncharacterized protein n=1 Tax=Pseudosulfitobacter pseudonitzschiae TaxID=1402135 RepID=A0A9Q2P3U6_9RHOB|nr:hypothetical protein [Pseudosulfitobacter pseudonitzschiae]MBM2293460.1 hypothetical protein [Pseudosulfitobacter pseudonitzschiae]MBM2298274.1 hypothetical protein [Pseudosulfitobacter pseudonitzschiae]MBM2303188.1 hypothetical protein [Pseudosulfitobacter pseudonitzschiae]MBM2312971.1 hypothetical protein [Pseudosulfitobacter pseudonitzschiae]MBM2317884.1 hypothetical protein [Pseudosulfitobacter pseudonitzschiae]